MKCKIHTCNIQNPRLGSNVALLLNSMSRRRCWNWLGDQHWTEHGEHTPPHLKCVLHGPGETRALHARSEKKVRARARSGPAPVAATHWRLQGSTQTIFPTVDHSRRQLAARRRAAVCSVSHQRALRPGRQTSVYKWLTFYTKQWYAQLQSVATTPLQLNNCVVVQLRLLSALL